MGWLDALEELTKTGYKKFEDVSGWGLQHVGKPVWGTAQYGLAEGLTGLNRVLPDQLHSPRPGFVSENIWPYINPANPLNYMPGVGQVATAMFGGAMSHPEEVAAAGPGRAAWEASAGYTPLAGRIINELTADPLSLIGAPEVGGGIRALAGFDEGVRFAHPVAQALLGVRGAEVPRAGSIAAEWAGKLAQHGGMLERIAPAIEPAAKGLYLGGVYPQELFGKYGYAPFKGVGWAVNKTGLIKPGAEALVNRDTGEFVMASAETVAQRAKRLVTRAEVAPHVDMVPVSPEPTSLWRRLVGSQTAGIVWQQRPGVEKTGLDQRDIDGLVGYVSDEMRSAHIRLKDRPEGAIEYAYRVPQQIYDELVAEHGQSIREVLPFVFREAKQRADFPFPDDALIGMHPLPEIIQSSAAARVARETGTGIDVHRFQNVQGSRGIRAQMHGDETNPGMFEVAAHDVASQLRLNRKEGRAASFTMPEEPGMAGRHLRDEATGEWWNVGPNGRIGLDAQGGMYHLGMNNEPETPMLLHHLVQSGERGPHGLHFVGDDGTPVVDVIRQHLRDKYGMEISDEETFNRLLDRGVDYYYRHQLIPAASPTAQTMAEARLYGEGALSRSEIVNQLGQESRAGAVYPEDMWGNIDPQVTAVLARTETGRRTLEELGFNPLTGVTNLESTRAQELGVRANPLEHLPANRQELKALGEWSRWITTYGEDSPDFYKAAGRVAHEISGGDQRLADTLLGMIGATSVRNAVLPNRNEGSQAFAKLRHFVDDPQMLADSGFNADEIRRLQDWAQTTNNFPARASGIAREVQRFANFDGSLLNDLGNSPKVFSFKFSQLIEARKLAIMEDETIPKAMRQQIVDGIDQTFADVVTDMWHGRALGFSDGPTNMQHLESYATTNTIARELGMLPSEYQSAIWKGGKNLGGTSDEVIDSMGVALDDTLSRLKANLGKARLDPKDFVINEWQKAIRGTSGAVGSMAGDRRTKVGTALTNDVIAKLTNVDPGESRNLFSLITPGGDNPSGVIEHAPARGYGVKVVERPILGPDGNPLPLDFVRGKLPPAIGRQVRDQTAEVLRRYNTAFATAWGDKLKLGYQIDRQGRLTVGLHLMFDDLGAAEATARQVGQGQIADYAEGGARSVGNGLSGDSPLRRGKDLIEQMQRSYHELELARKVARSPLASGIAYQTDPLSGVILDQLERAKHAASQSRFAQGYRNLRDAVGDATTERLAQAAPESVGATVAELPPTPHLPRHQGPQQPVLVGDKTREVMSRKFTQGDIAGKTWGEESDAYRARMAKGLKTIQESGSTFAADANLAARQSVFPKDDDAKWALSELDKMGFDPATASVHDVLAEHMHRLFQREHGVVPGKMSPFKLFRTAWGQQALISPRYHASNIVGSWMQMIAAGYRPNMNLAEYQRFIKSTFAGEGRDLTAANLSATKMAEIFSSWGIGELPMELARGNAEYGATGALSKNSLGKVAEKLAGKKIGHVVGKTANANQNFASAWEWYIRSGMGSDLFDHGMRRAMPVLQKQLVDTAKKNGIDLSGKINFVTREGLLTDGRLEIPAVHQALLDAGLKPQDAQDITRTFLNIRQTSLDRAIKEVNRVHFSYEFTNLDEFISKFVPFHYWSTRAARFYLEETLRHPMLYYWYNELNDGIDRMAQDPGLDARSKGFVNLMSGPYGFTLMMNPEALLGIAKVFDMDSGITPDGETRMGQILRVSKQHGVGLFPWVDATLNYMGAYGDTFAPDPVGLRTRQLIGATVNYARANLGMEPAPAPYEGANVKLRSWLSSVIAPLAPDWLSQPVAPKATEDGTLGRASLDDIITSRILAENPNLTNQELIDILNDPDRPEYDRAYQGAASAGLLQNILNFTLPTNFKVREDTRDVSRAQINTIRDAAKQAGVRPEDYVPTYADAEFQTAYKNKTGKDWQPGDFNRAQFKRDIATATPQARTFVIQEQEYNSLGSAEGQALIQKRNDILSGRWLPPQFAGRTLGAEQLGMVADYWLRQNDPQHLTDQIQALQHTYRQTHPQFDAYKSWQGQMYNLQANYGPNAFSYYRDQVSASNPNAARFFAAKQQDLIKYNPTATPQELVVLLDSATLSPDAWMAVTGQAPSQYESAPLPTNGPDIATQAVQFQQQQSGQPMGPSPFAGPPSPGTYSNPWIQALTSHA